MKVSDPAMMPLLNTQGSQVVIRKVVEWLATTRQERVRRHGGAKMELSVMYAQTGERSIMAVKFKSRVHTNDCVQRLKQLKMRQSEHKGKSLRMCRYYLSLAEYKEVHSVAFCVGGGKR